MVDRRIHLGRDHWSDHLGTMRHGAPTYPLPVEALLAEDYELTLVWAPLEERGNPCTDAECEARERCDCQEEEEEP